MPKSAIVDEAISFAKKVLELAPGEFVNVKHRFNYVNSTKIKIPSKKQLVTEENSKIIYFAPGRAKSLEIRTIDLSSKAGRFPQHNTQGDFSLDIELRPSLTLDYYRDLVSVFALEEAGFSSQNTTLTKKKIAKLALQFAHLSIQSFKEMLCLQNETDKRDFEIWVREEGFNQYDIAYVNPNTSLIQFMQTIIVNDDNQICDLRHVVYDACTPIVINQTFVDSSNRIRNVAHVGVTGSTSNSFVNSLERLDDGTLIWTTSDIRGFDLIAGSAALRDDGEVILFEDSNPTLAQFSARNLGAEGIDPRTQAWTGKFSPEACLPESMDKYIIRTQYKAAVRKQVNQIIDGACIPGLMPIFRISQLENISFAG